MNKLCMKLERIVHKGPRFEKRGDLSTVPHTLSTAFTRAPSKASCDNYVLFSVIPSERSLY